MRAGKWRWAGAVFGILFLVVRAGTARATTTVPALDTGWYDLNGFHDNDNKSYIAGYSDTNRDYFAFDLSGLSGTVAAANLRVYTYTAFGAGTLTLRDVNTPLPSLLSYTYDAPAIPTFDDLGTGNIYGDRDYTPLDNNTFHTIPLNATFLSDLNASLGGSIALGGSYIAGDAEYLFGFALGTPPDNAQLNLTFTPEPAGIALLTLVTVGFLTRRNRRQACPAR